MPTMTYLNLGQAPLPMDPIYDLLGVDQGIALDFLHNRALIRSAANPALNFNGLATALPGWSFIRTTGGSYFDADRIMRFAGNNEPRFDHDPATGAGRGLLVEPQATNVLLQSENLAHVSWGLGNIYTPTKDGTFRCGRELWKIEANGAGQALLTRAVTATDGVFTFLICRGNTDHVAGYFNGTSANSWAFNFSTGTFYGLNNVSVVRQVRVSEDTHIVSVRLTGGPTTGVGFAPRDTAYSGPGGIASPFAADGTYFYLDALQVEAGTNPTSYIPTEASAVTRSADLAHVPLSGLPIDPALPYTLIIDAEYGQPGGNNPGPGVTFSLSNVDNWAGVHANTAGFGARVRAGGSNLLSTTSAIGPGAPQRAKIALRVESGNHAVSGNGGAPITSATSGLPAGAVAYLALNSTFGASSPGFYYRIRSIALISRALSNSELQEASAL